MSRSLVLVGLLGIVGADASAAEPAPVASKRVAGLISRLGSDRYEERAAASRELEPLGAVALEKLKQACRSDDAEIRQRAEYLVSRINLRLESERSLQPTPVHLICKDMPLSDAVAELAAKSGFPVRVEGASQRRINLDTGATSFWNALSQLCDRAGLVEVTSMPTVRNESAQVQLIQRQLQMALIVRSGRMSKPELPGITLREGKPESLPVEHIGALRIRALAPNSPHLALTKADGEALCHLEITTEPTLEVLQMLPPRVVHAVDENGLCLKQLAQGEGQNLAPVWGMYLPYIDAPESPQRQTSIRLQLRNKQARRIAELHGTLALSVKSPPHPLCSFDNISKAAGKTIRISDTVSFTLKSIETKENRFFVELESNRPLGMQALNGWAMNGAAFGAGSNEDDPTDVVLYDASGKRMADFSAVPAWARRKQMQSPNLFIKCFTLEKDRQPTRLVLVGRHTSSIEVPFTLRNVPLPTP